MSKEYSYTCVNCGETYQAEDLRYLCPVCAKENKEGAALKGVLKLVYPYEKIKQALIGNPDFLIETDYLPLLPIESMDSMPPLLVGKTPLYSSIESRKQGGKFHLHLKVDSSNPTFSFKDRASALVSAYAREHQISTIIAASTGNAGSSLAGICASAKQEAIILVPESAPKAKLTQVLMYGAKLIPVQGSYDDAYDLSLRLTEKYGLYNRNTAFNPLTIEGKKTVSFELFDQMKPLAEKVFVPVGDGVIMSAVYKGFEDLLALGLIDKMPQIIAVQAEGSASLIDNLHRETPVFEAASTVADSISVDIPRNFYMAKHYLLDYNGAGVKVSDEEIIKASKVLSKEFGLFVEPAAATAYAGLLSYLKEGQISENEDVVVLLTGNGLKDISAVSSYLEFPPAVDPNTYDFKPV
jgi:threonine synthase